MMTNSQSDADYNIFRSILFYTTIIVSLPIASFFFSRYFLFDFLFGSSSVSSNVSSAVIAVIMLHLAVGFYIYKAYNQESITRKPDKLD